MGGRPKKNVGAIVGKNGVSFRVWAPFASSVAVTGSFNNWGETPLKGERGGYWYTLVREAKAGQEYKFVIRNGDSTYYRNDPRALHFTTSAGNSVIASPGFDWGDDDFKPPPLEEQVIYELHVGTFNRPDMAFNGTFADVIDKLDYLVDLGINMIELMPISSMLMDRGWGYAIDYIFAVESLYGGRHAFLKFVKAAHARGIGVILDVVYNHFGPDNSLDLWQFDGWHKNNMGGIYFYNDWRAETPWGNTRPDFGREEVRQYIFDNVWMWVNDCRVDGLRVDSTIFMRNVKGFNDDPADDLAEGWQLMQGINAVAKKANPAVITIAEDIGGNEYIVKDSGVGGAGFMTQWEVGLPHALRDALWSSDPASINLSGILSELSKRYNGNAFSRVVYSDSHDAAANGSARLNEIVSPGKADNLLARKQSLIAAAIIMTMPGVPMLFQGQEFVQGGSFTDWEGLDWHKAEKYAGIVQAHKHLVALRRNLAGVSAGLSGSEVNLMHLDENNKVISYHRWKNGGPKDDVVVVINFGNRAFENYALSLPRDGLWQVRFNSAWKGYSPDFKEVEIANVVAETGTGIINLPASSVVILSQDN